MVETNICFNKYVDNEKWKPNHFIMNLLYIKSRLFNLKIKLKSKSFHTSNFPTSIYANHIRLKIKNTVLLLN